MSRRVRVNVARWVCRTIGHKHPSDWIMFTVCERCHRLIGWWK